MPLNAFMDGLRLNVSLLSGMARFGNNLETTMETDQSVSHQEILDSLRFMRTHLYAANTQFLPGDDAIIMRHVYDAYKRVSELCKEIELHGIKAG
jgi:alanine racemase